MSNWPIYSPFSTIHSPLSKVYYDKKQLYTPALEPYEFTERALIVDTETVGAGPLIEVIEVALCDWRGAIVYESLARPAFNPLPKPSAHHRFDRAEFDCAPDWNKIWPEVDKIIEGKLLIAYNATFDRRALAATCSRYQLASSEWAWRDAMQFVKKILGVKKSLSLEEACAAYGLPGGTHRAADDVRATHAMLMKALKK